MPKSAMSDAEEAKQPDLLEASNPEGAKQPELSGASEPQVARQLEAPQVEEEVQTAPVHELREPPISPLQA